LRLRCLWKDRSDRPPKAGQEPSGKVPMGRRSLTSLTISKAIPAGKGGAQRDGGGDMGASPRREKKEGEASVTAVGVSQKKPVFTRRGWRREKP